jgi:hypothetical protein
MPTNKEAFEQWLDGKTVERENEQNGHDDEQLEGYFETSLWLKHQAEYFEEQPVPEWDRGATFNPGIHKSEAKRDWLSWLRVPPGVSMAMSVAAILMVLFRVEIHFGDNGLLLTFAGDSARQTQLMMDEKLREFGRDQQIIMANYVDDIQTQQRDGITQLATYLVDTSRQERKEDMHELVSFLNVQRDDDLSLQQLQLNNVIYNINQQTVRPSLKRVSFDPNATPISNKEEK